MPNDYCVRGRYYEVLFKAECLKRGLTVLSPECGHLPFDVAVFSGDKLLRVQIKGRRDSPNYPYYEFRMIKPKGSTLYAELGVDIVAAYVEPKDLWYIIPTADCRQHKIKIQKAGTGSMESYRGAWQHLGYVSG